MGKTLTITDDELGATATVRIEQARDGTPVVRAVHFDAADDRGLSSAAMGLVEALGLRLPATPPVVHPAPRRRAAPKSKPARRAAPRAAEPPPPAVPAPEGPAALPAAPAPAAAVAPAPAQRRYRTGPPPGHDELRRSFRAHHGVIAAMAEEYGCAPTTMAGWLRRAREAGAQISVNGVAPAGAGS